MNRVRAEQTLSVTHTMTLGAWNQSINGGAGWSIGPHHAYSFESKTLHLGDGSTRTATALKDFSLESVAGSRATGPPVSGGSAQTAFLNDPENIVAGPDGSLYVTETAGTHRIRPDGILETIAPASLGEVSAVAPDGSLYLVDVVGDAVRRRAPDGTVTVVAGTPGQAGFAGDGGPATSARLDRPCNLALAPDGSFYVADANNNRIRRVSTDGTITTYAGSGEFGGEGDGGPAVNAQFFNPCSIALGPDGSLYVGDISDARVRRIGIDGIITTVAGNGDFGFSGDGGPATAAALDSVWRLSVAADGTLYIADFSNGRVRRVDAEGIIATVGGNGQVGFGVDGGSATAAPVGDGIGGVVVSPDGGVYVAAFGSGSSSARILAIRSKLPAIAPSDSLIPSDDGSELYVLDNSGRHLRTLHGTTLAILVSFGYDEHGLLQTITDGHGNVTRIERSGRTATAIVAPGGQRTALGVDTRGYLTSVSNPANQSWAIGYRDDGLMTSFRLPAGATATFQYDDRGRLRRDADAAGGSFTLDVVESGRTTLTTFTTAEGRAKSYTIERRASGDVRRVVTNSDGTTSVLFQGVDGRGNVTAADGTITSQQLGDDPRWARRRRSSSR